MTKKTVRKMKTETLRRRTDERSLEIHERKVLLQRRLAQASRDYVAAGGKDDVWAEMLDEHIRRDGNLLR